MVYQYTTAANPFSFDFEENGPGVHVLTTNNWLSSHWYSMCVGVKSFGGFTFYAQWIAYPYSYTDGWELLSIIRIPGENRTFNKNSVFQEDFAPFNREDLRACRISHAFGRNATTGNWQAWYSGTVSNRYYPTFDPTIYSDNYLGYCSWGTGTYSQGGYVYLRAGGNATPVGTLPYSFNLMSTSLPNSYPQFPRCIKSYYSNLYVSPALQGTDVVQVSVRYWWNIIDAGGGYCYILTTDKTMAISISGTGCGDDLQMTAFNGGNDSQKWKLNPSGNIYYLLPKNNENMNMDIEGPSTAVYTKLQIWTHDTSTPQFKWYLL